MSLHELLPAPLADTLLDGDWPTEPAVVDRAPTRLDEYATPAWFWHLVRTGTIPADKIGMMQAGPGLHPGAFTDSMPRTPGAWQAELDPAKMLKLYAQGYTIRVGYLQKFVPFFADFIQAIQRQTGYASYVHAFATPGGRQGLRHHWDQQLAVIVQVDGVKRWPLWRPVVDAPMRAYGESFRVWRQEMLDGWEASGPDLTVDLEPGQALLLPRGWVHNPHAPHEDQASLHLTIAMRERTDLWLAEQLVAEALQERRFREIVTPDVLTGDALADRLAHVGKALAEFATGISGERLETLAEQVRAAAVTDWSEVRT
jgi:hypothetical protein